MNVIDENIVSRQRKKSTGFGIHFKQIGFELGRRGMKDQNDVIPMLHHLARPTFFTRDRDYYKPALRHSDYCLVYLDVSADETAEYIRRFLRHPAFRTWSRRVGSVVRLRHSGLNYWAARSEREAAVGW